MEKRKSKVLRLTESELVSLIESVLELADYHDPNRLYKREDIVNKIKYARDEEIRKQVKKLPYIECQDNLGNSEICTKISGQIFTFLKGGYRY
jgi:hypothetical protein